MSFTAKSCRVSRLGGSLLCIILPVLWPSAVSGQTGNPLPLISVNGSSGLLLMVQNPAPLTVQVTDRSGVAIPAVNVIFIAPASGAGGTFQNATPDRATFLRAATDANGQATVTFVPNNTPGVYLVEAAIENTPAATSFAITTAAPDATPALSADDARSGVKQQFMTDVVEDELIRLHGPWLLPAGTVLSTENAAPFTTASSSWLFWLDRYPAARFSHPSSFILVDAANASPDLSAARVIAGSFWPILALPGSDAALPLLPPSRTNGTLTAALASPPVAAAMFKAGIGHVPIANTCAVVLYGADERDQKVDVQNMSDLFQNTLGIQNTFTSTDPDGNLHPASIADLQSSVAQSIQTGCKKLYLYISTHGGEANVDMHDLLGGSYLSGRILFSQKVDGVYQTQRLTYESLANILKPLKDSHTELCLIVDACFAANAIPAMQNLGISGLVVTATDRASFAPSNFFSVYSGGYFTDGLFTVWKSLLPGPDHLVGLDTAMASLQARGAGLFLMENPLSGNPQIATIDPNGGIFPASDLTVPSSVPKSSPVMLVIKRPAGVSDALAIKFIVSDPNVITFANGPQALTTMKAGTDSVTLTLTAVHDGTTTYTLTTQDNNNKNYVGTGTITIGDGYSVQPDPINLKVGESKSASLFRNKDLQGFAGQVTCTPNSPGIASLTPATLVFKAGDLFAPTSITGVGPGTSNFICVDGANRQTSFQAMVSGSPAAACPTGTVQFNVKGTITSDLDDSGRFVGIIDGLLTIKVNGTQVSVLGDRPQLAPASGIFDPLRCAFSINGVSTSPIAGFNNVHVTYTDVQILGPNFTRLFGAYMIATQGDFNGERPVSYSLIGDLKF